MAASTTGTKNPYYGQPINVGQYYNMTATNSGELVKSGEGALYSITLNKPTATSVITMYDGTSTSGTVIGTITIPASPMPVTLVYDVFFATGLFVSQGTAASDLTIAFK